MVGTELVMELGGASMPDGCSGGSGGGGPVSDRVKQNLTFQFNWHLKGCHGDYANLLKITVCSISFFFHLCF